MTKPKAKKPENLGKGTVTPVQIAFLVDQYLSDNSYTQSRSLFRTEASSLFSKSPLREVPKSLLSLSEILNEYIALKEQKVLLDHEKARVEQEKSRVQTLLNGLQISMNIYNAGGNPQISKACDAVPKQMLMAPQPRLMTGSSAAFPMHRIPVVYPVVTPANTNLGPVNFCSPIISNLPATKRKASNAGGGAPPASKRSRSKASVSKIPNKGVATLLASSSSLNNQGSAAPTSAVQSSLQNCAPNGSLVQGSTVAKCLFTQPSFSNATNSSVPQTPPRAISSQTDKSVSPVENSAISTSSDNNSPPEISANCCTIFSSKRVTLTPNKACYTVETNHCISSSPAKTSSRMSTRREHVKGRLNFDRSDVPVGLDKPLTDEKSADKPIRDEILTSDSEKEVDIFDIDMPNFEALGADFNFNEMLGELDLDYGELGFPCQPSSAACMGNVSGSSHEYMDGNEGTNQVMSEFSSTVTEVISEKGTSAQGPDSMTTMKSVTKSIRIISPVKKRGSSVDEKCTEIN
ncbi:uncharacterized protein LOC126798005 isoform X2 [Argentina anserina]|uniref:uncharacterized protein LOC126798005 isoform X2 n=1 Tax=Argentina anserina TaxID=57926 RepID=UPI0021767D3D|nr:uncharacterized protein LOC126798005 isoform X2 [Potentilla anserina]